MACPCDKGIRPATTARDGGDRTEAAATSSARPPRRPRGSRRRRLQFLGAGRRCRRQPAAAAGACGGAGGYSRVRGGSEGGRGTRPTAAWPGPGAVPAISAARRARALSRSSTLILGRQAVQVRPTWPRGASPRRIVPAWRCRRRAVRPPRRAAARTGHTARRPRRTSPGSAFQYPLRLDSKQHFAHVLEGIRVLGLEPLPQRQAQLVLDVDRGDLVPGVVGDAAVAHDRPAHGVGDVHGDLVGPRVALLHHAFDPLAIEEPHAIVAAQGVFGGHQARHGPGRGRRKDTTPAPGP